MSAKRGGNSAGWISMLGKMPDGAIEKRTAIPLKTIREEREFRGIEKYAPPMPGFIYMMHEGTSGAIKVGMSSKPQQRQKDIQTDNPGVISIIALVATKDMKKDEAKLHDALARRHTRRTGEWYWLSVDEAHTVARCFSDKVQLFEPEKNTTPKKVHWEPMAVRYLRGLRYEQKLFDRRNRPNSRKPCIRAVWARVQDRG